MYTAHAAYAALVAKHGKREAEALIRASVIRAALQGRGDFAEMRKKADQMLAEFGRALPGS